MDIAEGVAPILSVMALGTVFASASFPALSVLYSRKRLRPVVAVSLIYLVVLLPLLILAVVYFGVMGAAYIWGLYGFILYVAFQFYGLQGLPNTGLFSSGDHERLQAHFILEPLFNCSGSSHIGEDSALLVCKDLRKILMDKWRW